MGTLSFDSFEDWLITNSKGIRDWGDLESNYLVASIDLEMAEYVLGYLTEKELRSALLNAANTFMLNLNSTNITTTASATMLTKSDQLKIQPVDMGPSTASSLPAPR